MNQSHDTTPSERSPQVPTRLSEVLHEGVEVKLHLVQHYAELALLLVREILEDNVTGLCGPRYSRHPPGHTLRRWGTNPGSVQIQDERVSIPVPRVRDVETGREEPLETYQQMKAPLEVDSKMEEAIVLGLAQRDYGQVAGAFVEGFGLSQSSVSRAFQERSAGALAAFEERRLDTEDFVALWIDGKYLAGVQIVICLGLTMDGRKLPLGFIESTTENAAAIQGLFRDLIGRGFRFEEGLLCVIDGAKGLYRAVQKTFGAHAQIQRCQWHKRENVVGYLAKKDQAPYRTRLRAAYRETDYKSAKSALMAIHTELEGLNRSAARSLMEGLEETLTLHRLGLFAELGTSLRTTNCIENLNGQLTKYIGRVKRWMHSDQRQRWVAMGLLQVEKRMNRISGRESLPLLRAALQKQIPTSPPTPQKEPLADESFN